MGSRDPLNLGELEPEVLQANIHARDTKGKKISELELQKEARLAEKEKRLNASKLKPPPEVPSTAPPPPQFDRSVALDKIAAYRERFSNLKKRNNVTAKSTDAEIEDELHYIELQLGSQGSGTNMGATMLYAGAIGIEKFTRDYWNPLGLNLNGLGTITQQNMTDFQPLIDELMIKHSAGHYTSVEWRLALMMGATILTVNAANQNPDMARAVKSMNQAVNVPGGSKDL